MAALSQIVGYDASPILHSVCVSRILPPWQFGGMESTDKNGGPNHLRAWRLKAGLSQAALAEKVGTNANMIQYLENGERGLSAKWLRRLAPALNTAPGHLLDVDPDEADMEVVDFWARKLDKDQRRQLVAIAEALVKAGANE